MTEMILIVVCYIVVGVTFTKPTSDVNDISGIVTGFLSALLLMGVMIWFAPEAKYTESLESNELFPLYLNGQVSSEHYKLLENGMILINTGDSQIKIRPSKIVYSNEFKYEIYKKKHYEEGLLDSVTIQLSSYNVYETRLYIVQDF